MTRFLISALAILALCAGAASARAQAPARCEVTLRTGWSQDSYPLAVAPFDAAARAASLTDAFGLGGAAYVDLNPFGTVATLHGAGPDGDDDARHAYFTRLIATRFADFGLPQAPDFSKCAPGSRLNVRVVPPNDKPIDVIASVTVNWTAGRAAELHASGVPTRIPKALTDQALTERAGFPGSFRVRIVTHEDRSQHHLRVEDKVEWVSSSSVQWTRRWHLMPAPGGAALRLVATAMLPGTIEDADQQALAGATLDAVTGQSLRDAELSCSATRFNIQVCGGASAARAATPPATPTRVNTPHDDASRQVATPPGTGAPAPKPVDPLDGVSRCGDSMATSGWRKLPPTRAIGSLRILDSQEPSVRARVADGQRAFLYPGSTTPSASERSSDVPLGRLSHEPWRGWYACLDANGALRVEWPRWVTTHYKDASCSKRRARRTLGPAVFTVPKGVDVFARPRDAEEYERSCHPERPVREPPDPWPPR